MQSQLRLQRCAFGSRSAARPVVLVRAQANSHKKSFTQFAEKIVSTIQVPALAKPAALAAITNVLATLPAHAGEPGKIFDFNLTLPIMATQFLLLMVFLEKTWFTPVGKVLDERDRQLRDKLGSVKDNSSELERLQKEAEEVIANARSKASAEVQAAKRETDQEIEEAAAAKKKELDAELEKALATLESEQKQALADVDSKVDSLVEQVITRVLPEGIKA